MSCGTLPSRARLRGGLYALDQAAPSQCANHWPTRKPLLATAQMSEGPEVLSDCIARAPGGTGIRCQAVPFHHAATGPRNLLCRSLAAPPSHVSAAPSPAMAETYTPVSNAARTGRTTPPDTSARYCLKLGQ